VRRSAHEARWLPDGVRLRFAADAERLAMLATFIDLERRCCAFLRFRLTIEPGGGPVWLELTGPPGTREFLAAELTGPGVSVAPAGAVTRPAGGGP
jgi:hypothetical protein